MTMGYWDAHVDLSSPLYIGEYGFLSADGYYAWADVLDSGKYLPGKSQLRIGSVAPTYCCLGVFAERCGVDFTYYSDLAVDTGVQPKYDDALTPLNLIPYSVRRRLAQLNDLHGDFRLISYVMRVHAEDFADSVRTAATDHEQAVVNEALSRAINQTVAAYKARVNLADPQYVSKGRLNADGYRKWADVLDSGRYKPGHGFLMIPEGATGRVLTHCCLGVFAHECGVPLEIPRLGSDTGIRATGDQQSELEVLNLIPPDARWYLAETNDVFRDFGLIAHLLRTFADDLAATDGTPKALLERMGDAAAEYNARKEAEG